MTNDEIKDIAGQVKSLLLSDSISLNELTAVSSIEGLIYLMALKREGTLEQAVSIPASLLTASMRVTNTHLQYKVGGGSWQDLIELQSIKGQTGDSAFQLWQKEEGNSDKTYEDYVAYIESPARGAAETLTNQMAGIVQESASQMVQVSQNTKLVLDETKKKVDDILAYGGLYHIVSSVESEVGKLRWGRKEYIIYELTAELSGLPVTAGGSATVIISDNPVGDNLYLKVDCLSVSTSTGFPVSAYEVNKVYVDDQMNTVATIACKEAVTGNPKALLTIRYVRGMMSYDTFHISIPVSELGISSAEAVTVEMPTLKYNKKFALSWTTDDALLSVYCYMHKYINKKYIDNTYNYHDGMPPTTGYIPTRVLCSTDGCGNDVRFRVDSGWVSYNDNISDGIHSDSFPYEYVRWSEMITFFDFLNSAMNHGGGNQTKPLESIEMCGNRLFEKTGYFPFLLLVPGGTTGYQDTAETLDYLYHYHNKENLNYSCDTLTKGSFVSKTGLLGRKTYDGMTYEQLCSYVDTQAVRSDHPYSYLGGHTVADGSKGQIQWTPAVKPFLDYLHDTYGKGGNDSIWMAGPEEIYEYLFTRSYSVLSKSISAGNLVIKVKAARLPLFKKNEISVLVKKNGGITNTISTLSIDKKVMKSSFALKGGELLININYNSQILQLAEKYTSKYEASSKDTDKEDARYFISQLSSELGAPFIARINAGEVPPVLNTVSINSNAATTYDRNASVMVNVTGAITHYKISEASNLSGASWISSTSKTFNFNLSTGYGSKTVYVQVKNSYGESGIKSDSITYKEKPAVTFVVTGQSNNTNYGAVSPATQIVEPGGTANLTAAAKSGYVIGSWDGATSGTGVGTPSGIAIASNVQADKTVVCNFKTEGGSPGGGAKSIYSAQNGFTNSYGTLDNGDTINLLRNNNSSGSAHFDIKSTKGDVIGQIIQEKDDLPGSQDLGMSVNSSPELTGDAGVYKDIYLSSLLGLYTASMYPAAFGQRKWKLSEGTYNVKVLYSTKTNLSIAKLTSITYDCNGVVVTIPSDYPYLNNNSTFVEINNVAVGSDGILDLKFGSTMDYIRAGFNLIEIEKIS